VPITLILDPSLALICWVHFAPPIGDAFRKSYRKLLRWNDEYPFVKFALTDDDRPMLMTELPPDGVDRDAVARTLVRLTVVADRLLDETAAAVADGGGLPDWSSRTPRNQALLNAHRDEVEATMPAWEPAPIRPRRRGLLERLLGSRR
jgi:hypothetical protein